MTAYWKPDNTGEPDDTCQYYYTLGRADVALGGVTVYPDYCHAWVDTGREQECATMAEARALVEEWTRPMTTYELFCAECGADLLESLEVATMVPRHQMLYLPRGLDEWGDDELFYEAEVWEERPYYCGECGDDGPVTARQHELIEQIRAGEIPMPARPEEGDGVIPTIIAIRAQLVPDEIETVRQRLTNQLTLLTEIGADLATLDQIGPGPALQRTLLDAVKHISEALDDIADVQLLFRAHQALKAAGIEDPTAYFKALRASSRLEEEETDDDVNP